MGRTADRDALLRFGDMIDIGSSDGHKCRHDWKNELAEQGIYKSSDQAHIIPITNTKTLEKFKTTLDEITKSLNVKGISGGLAMLSPQTARAFLIEKAITGTSLKTCRNYSSALTKISSMIHHVAEKIERLRSFSLSQGGSGDIRELTLDQRREYIQENGITGDARALRDCKGDQALAAEKYVDDFIKAYGEVSIHSGLSDALKVDFTSVQAEYKRDVLPNIENAGKEVHAFRNPEKVIDCIKGTAMTVAGARLAAEIQLRCGFREENALRSHLNSDGTISFYSKGHMQHDHFKIPADLYQRLKAYDKGGGRVVVMSDRTYRDAISRAAARAGEDLRHASAPHSFRHAFAKSMYSDLIHKGASIIETKAKVSEALFHKRLDIVELYLK
ncbi:MAG: hypothetical protein IKW79_06355 [Schwartzia sp.]|nr:hypothetical protein [Schwartzia sp. (in: firmicutes)]